MDGWLEWGWWHNTACHQAVQPYARRPAGAWAACGGVYHVSAAQATTFAGPARCWLTIVHNVQRMLVHGQPSNSLRRPLHSITKRLDQRRRSPARARSVVQRVEP